MPEVVGVACAVRLGPANDTMAERGLNELKQACVELHEERGLMNPLALAGAKVHNAFQNMSHQRRTLQQHSGCQHGPEATAGRAGTAAQLATAP